MSAKTRYFHNNTSTLLKEPNPKQHMIDAITQIIQNYPPTQHFQTNDLLGIYIGPTSIAYLCLHLSKAYPDLVIAGQPLSHWTTAYLSASKGRLPKNLGPGGVLNEEFAAACVAVALKQDAATLATFDAALPKVVEEANDGVPTEYIYGLAGTLVLLRLVARWAPELEGKVQPAQQAIISRILARGPPWFYREKQIIGPGHGEMGILTQVVLTDPARARELEPKLVELLERQLDDGNWPYAVGQEKRDLVHWCHGAPGCVVSLMAVRPYFLDLRPRIDAAIEKGRALIWERGVLTKEPNLCHGTTGNALALLGEQREHFMAQTTEEFMEEGMKEGRYELNDAKWSLMAGWAGQAWGWMVVDKGMERGLIGFDVV